MSTKRSALWLLFGIFAILAVGATLFIFELRYMWFVSKSEFALLRSIEITGICLIFVSWALYPSRLATLTVGIIMLVTPAFIPSSKFVPIDAAFLAWVCLAAVLMLAATQLNIKARRSASTSGLA
ncbi:MAG: hypothetical protein ACREO0_10400 [Pseudoxanthomonas sp.]